MCGGAHHCQGGGGIGEREGALESEGEVHLRYDWPRETLVGTIRLGKVEGTEGEVETQSLQVALWTRG